LVGNSTIALYYDFDYPLTGWGEKLKGNVKVHNFGVGGASKFAAKEIKKLYNYSLNNINFM
jgi:hypothetical protein